MSEVSSATEERDGYKSSRLYWVTAKLPDPYCRPDRIMWHALCCYALSAEQAQVFAEALGMTVDKVELAPGWSLT